jgi:hypothetical protein
VSATRLLVLGAIRTMQPVHGYVVRRELVSWRLEETTNVKPGSIYGAIRTLVKDGATGADGDIPEHVREIVDFISMRTRAEIEWTKGLRKRLRDGAYTFAGEPGFPDLGPGRGWHSQA